MKKYEAIVSGNSKIRCVAENMEEAREKIDANSGGRSIISIKRVAFEEVN